MPRYILTCEPQGTHKFRYQVRTSANGTVLAERISPKHYVAATIDGTYFFESEDAINTGEHRKDIDKNRKLLSKAKTKDERTSIGATLLCLTEIAHLSNK